MALTLPFAEATSVGSPALNIAIFASFVVITLVIVIRVSAGKKTAEQYYTAAGAFTGLRSATGRDELVQAVLEGVGYAARDNLAALGRASSEITEVDLVGGGSRSSLWAQIMADVLGIPVHRVEEGEVGAALGAARLGRLAATGEDPANVCSRPRRLASFAPRASKVAAYDESYSQWRKLYPALKECSA